MRDLLLERLVFPFPTPTFYPRTRGGAIAPGGSVFDYHALAGYARGGVMTGFVPDPRAFMRRWMREVVPGVNQRSEVPS
jgi:hypothetical protein